MTFHLSEGWLLCGIFCNIHSLFEQVNHNQIQNSQALTWKKCEKCSKITIETPEWRQNRRSRVFVVNFEHIWHLFLVFLLLILNRLMFSGKLFKILYHINHRSIISKAFTVSTEARFVFWYGLETGLNLTKVKMQKMPSLKRPAVKWNYLPFKTNSVISTFIYLNPSILSNFILKDSHNLVSICEFSVITNRI